MGLPLSGFTAIPNPYMIPFMGYQSWVIGSMFGMAYQGYKRKISAMSNEDFNKLDLTDFGFSEMRKMTAMTPRMEQMFAEMRPMLDIMARELNLLFKKIPDYVSTVATGSPQGGYGGFGTAQLVNPAGIDANMELWYSQGIISKEMYDTWKHQYSGALSAAGAANERDRIAATTDTSGQTLAEFERIRKQRLMDQETSRRITASEAKTKQIENELRAKQARQPVVTGQRRAGQSQINERNRLVTLIKYESGRLKDAMRANERGSNNALIVTARRNSMTDAQAKLTILLQRYKF